ncbi:MAG: hypothetical protein DYG98_10120 [Haliscomenobacteraceae bacterium CHB4]|nr:hypothetical protein [Haliscomenobacteraceae bacterium CHB4]
MGFTSNVVIFAEKIYLKMTAIFSLSSSELDASIIEKIRSFAQGRKVKITIQVEEEKIYTQPAKTDSQVAEEAVEYARKMLREAGEKNKEKIEELRRFYAQYQVDMSNYKFNRDEANER